MQTFFGSNWCAWPPIFKSFITQLNVYEENKVIKTTKEKQTYEKNVWSQRRLRSIWSVIAIRNDYMHILTSFICFAKALNRLSGCSGCPNSSLVAVNVTDLAHTSLNDNVPINDIKKRSQPDFILWLWYSITTHSYQQMKELYELLNCCLV